MRLRHSAVRWARSWEALTASPLCSGGIRHRGLCNGADGGGRVEKKLSSEVGFKGILRRWLFSALWRWGIS